MRPEVQRVNVAREGAPRSPGANFRSRLREVFRKSMRGIAGQEYEYRSSRRVFGIPVFAVNLGPPTPSGMRHARGIIAIGSKATGVIAIGAFVARGGLAIAPLAAGVANVSVAGVGALTVAVFGIGVASVSVVAIGYLAIGILALGYKSVGIIALGSDAVGIVTAGRNVNTLFR